MAEQKSSTDTAASLRGPAKAAIVFVAMGKEAAAEVMSYLSEEEIEKITVEIARLKDISAGVEEVVLKEFHEMLLAHEYITEGGVDYARELLEESVGIEKADEILRRIHSTLHPSGFGLLKDVDPSHLLEFIRNEHPQTISFILSQLEPIQGASVLSQLPEEVQADVAIRIATMEKIYPEVIHEIEGVMDTQLKAVMSGNLSTSGGIKATSEILNLVDRSTEKSILGNMEMENPELAASIKNLMFVFEDLLLLDDRAIQTVLKEIDSKELSVALKAASDDLKEKLFKNLSERVATMIKEEMEFAGPVRLSIVEEAQQRIVEVVRRLEEEQQIVVVRGTEGGEQYI